MPIIPDILDYNLKLLICGSALGNVSAQKRAYYAHPANRFWKNLFEVGFTQRLLSPQEYPALLNYQIGITDLAKEESGVDAQLSKQAYDSERLLKIVKKYKPAFLVFSALRPARSFLKTCFGIKSKDVKPGLQHIHIGTTKIYITTSTSPRYPYQERTLELWKHLYKISNAQ